MCIRAIHALEHLRLRLAIRSGVGLHSAGIESRLGTIFLVLGNAMLAEGAVIWRSHVGLGVLGRRLGRGELAGRADGSGSRGSLAGAFSVGSGLLARDDVDEEVEHVRFGEGGGDIGALQGAAFVVLGVDPGAHGQLGDEDVAALCEQDGGLCGNHLDVGVGLHDLLYASQWQLMDLVVVVIRLEVVDDVLPVCS